MNPGLNTIRATLDQWLKVSSLFCVACVLSACAATLPNPPNAGKYSDEQLVDFKERITEVAKLAQSDPDYNRIPLDSTKDQKSFLEIALEYWAGDMDRATFISEGNRRFPGHDYEFNVVADHLR